eukprot:NODE_152_length_15391_cov_0.883272.p14 type:complete len:196 gc:universal NODE_152_length_15391_cov_0.883272:130-717(+)
MLMLIFAILSQIQKTLVLDLDHTLIHAIPFQLPPNTKMNQMTLIDDVIIYLDTSPVIQIDSNSYLLCIDHEYYKVYIRPFARELIEIAHSNQYEIIIYTAASQYYADLIIPLLDTHNRITLNYYRQDCHALFYQHQFHYYKYLTVLNRDMDHLIMLDDNPQYVMPKENVVGIIPYQYDQEDDELEKFAKILENVG